MTLTLNILSAPCNAAHPPKLTWPNDSRSCKLQEMLYFFTITHSIIQYTFTENSLGAKHESRFWSQIKKKDPSLLEFLFLRRTQTLSK